MASWEYNCPKFANLAACMDESISELEKYFEVDHEDEARNRRTTRRAAAATAASSGTRDPKVEQPVQNPPSTLKTKAGCRLTRQKERKVVDTCREAPALSDATAEPPEPARESLTICEITGNRNTGKSEERSNSASTSAVKSCKRETSTKKRILARRPVAPSLNGNVVAMKMEEPPSKETESTAGTIKTKPRRKGATAMGKSGTLKNYTKSKADESVSGATTSQSSSSKNVSQKGNSAVNSDKKGKTLASAASKEKSGTKGGSAKRKKPLAAAKMTRRASSSHHVSTVIKPHLQGISEKLSQPVKTFRSGKVQLQRPIKMNAQDRPQEKMKDEKPVKIAATQSSSGSETEKPTHFKAKPAPDRSRVFRLRNMSAPVTKPKPFRLASLERHQECMLEFQKKKERIEAERLQKTKFIARPVPRSNRQRPESVDRTVVRATKPGPSEHISRPRRR